MKTQKARIGNFDVLISTIERNIEVIIDDNSPLIEQTSIKENVGDAYESVKSVIQGIAADFAQNINKMKKETKPSELELEFSLSLSAETNFWVISGDTEAALKVKMLWK